LRISVRPTEGLAMQSSHPRKSFDEIMVDWMNERGPKVRSMLCRKGLTREEAEDTIQDAFVKAYEHRNDGRGPRPNPEGWLARVAINAAIDHLRGQNEEAKGRKRLAELGKARDSHDPFADKEKEAIIGALLALLDGASLFDLEFTAVKLRFFKQYTFAQIADWLEVADGTASRWNRQGLQRLREALEALGIKFLPDPR
jgi:RNA polymerase sigma-70 factor (ECF subfamily)